MPDSPKLAITVSVASSLLTALILWGVGSFMGLIGGKLSEQQVIDAAEALLQRDDFLPKIAGRVVDEPVVAEALPREAPVGSIIAWHRNLPDGDTLSLDTTLWVECNGQVLDDDRHVESPFFGKVIPDLNMSSRFLRGSRVSGEIQNDSVGPHWHYVSVASSESKNERLIRKNREDSVVGIGDHSGGIMGYHFLTSTASPNAGRSSLNMHGEGSGEGRDGGDETRPANMSVVWIIRVK